jgi:Flp pilus assembly protein TadB
MGVTAAVAAVVGTTYAVYSGERAADKQAEALSQQREAQTQAKAQAESQQKRSEMAQNAANRKQPDVAGIMQSAGQGASGGPSGTMLTGPTGVDPNALSLGKNTLLGG